MYTTKIGVGNPPVHFNAAVDTSWSTLFVPSANCSYNEHKFGYCKIHPLYNSSLSSTYQADLTPAILVYKGGAGLRTWGNVSQDSIHIGSMEVKEQRFEEAKIWHPDYANRDDLFDSALGLALLPPRQGIDPDNFFTPSPFHNMVQQGLLDENLFSLKLPRTDYEAGELVLGSLPQNLKRETMIEVPLDDSKADDPEGFWTYYTMSGWQIPVSNMTMTSNNSETSIAVLESPRVAVISSSFPWIGVPHETAKKIQKAIGISRIFRGTKCDERSNLPNWTIEFGPDGQTITLTPWDYLLEAFDPNHGQQRCMSAFFPPDLFEGEGFIIFGAPFLNGLDSVFDADRKSILFANRPL